MPIRRMVVLISSTALLVCLTCVTNAGAKPNPPGSSGRGASLGEWQGIYWSKILSLLLTVTRTWVTGTLQGFRAPLTSHLLIVDGRQTDLLHGGYGAASSYLSLMLPDDNVLDVAP